VPDRSPSACQAAETAPACRAGEDIHAITTIAGRADGSGARSSALRRGGRGCRRSPCTPAQARGGRAYCAPSRARRGFWCDHLAGWPDYAPAGD
jgi:hypothetical protein